MAKDLPVVCSLGAGDLEQRLATIAEIGRRSLLDREVEAGRHLLRFRSDPQTRLQLEGVVAAEAECCAFLALSLKEDGEDLVLSIAAPEAGQATADGFAMAFEAGRPPATATAWAIRRGDRADLAAVVGFWRVAESVPTATDTEGALEALLAQDADALLVAEAGEAIIGSLIAAWDGWRGSFYRLAVDPSWRCQGVATALIRAGEERLARLGAIRLTAIVASDRGPAMGFWAAAGYERQSARSRFVRMLGS
jgi:ribosomal protein S18 acetylase RimI-like enzyme